MNVMLLTVSLMALPVVTSCASDESGERATISRIIEDSIGWFKTKDIDRLFEVFPEDPDLLVIHPDSASTVLGGKNFREGATVFLNPRNKYLYHRISDLRIIMSESGTVAWWSALLDDCGSYGGREMCWKDCRWTGVVEKRRGKWVIVQTHFSLASDKVAAEALAVETEPDEEYADYTTMRQRVVDLFAKRKYSAAASILKKGLDKFPEQTVANTYNLSLAAILQHDEEKAIYWLEEGHRRGIFFGNSELMHEIWKPLAENPRFLEFRSQNKSLLAATQSRAKMQLCIVKPDGYSPQQHYPLFIALHGGGENTAEFKPRWISPRMQKDFVVAYVQSSQVASMTGFYWQDDAITRQDLARAWREIQDEVLIDQNNIFIGGSACGGYGSLLALFGDIIPARGFILFCPELPANPSGAELAPLVRRKVSGTIITSDMDNRIERQKAFSQFMTAENIPVRLQIVSSDGHWYPINLPQLIDDALAHLLQ